MRIAIIQSNYIPWIGYFELIRNVDKFILYEDVQYTKNDWRNRNYLRENEKINWLSIPIKHQSLKQKFNEVLVSDNIWTKKHFNTIHHTFSKEKNFRKYDEELLSLYKQSASEIYLYKINRIFLNWVLFKLNITTEIQYIEKLENTNCNSRYIMGWSIDGSNHLDYIQSNKIFIKLFWVYFYFELSWTAHPARNYIIDKTARNRNHSKNQYTVSCDFELLPIFEYAITISATTMHNTTNDHSIFLRFCHICNTV